MLEVTLGASSNLQVLNFFGGKSTLVVEVHSLELDPTFLVLNKYGAYVKKLEFWYSILENHCYKANSLIVGGDLNFTLSVDEA